MMEVFQLLTTNNVNYSNSDILTVEIAKISELVKTGKKIQLEYDKKRDMLKVIELKSHIIDCKGVK